MSKNYPIRAELFQKCCGAVRKCSAPERITLKQSEKQGGSQALQWPGQLLRRKREEKGFAGWGALRAGVEADVGERGRAKGHHQAEEGTRGLLVRDVV